MRWRKARDAMQQATDRMVAAGEGKKFVGEENLKVGDLVLLNSNNYKQFRAHKLAPPYLGPFTVKRVISTSAVELDLPGIYKLLHPVINIDNLKKYEGQLPTPPPPSTDPQGHQQYNIDHIVAERMHRGRKQYLIRWEGYTPEHDSWEPESRIRQCKDIVAQFKASLPPPRRGRRG